MKKYIVYVLITINIILGLILGTKVSQYKTLSEDDKEYIRKINELKQEELKVKNEIGLQKEKSKELSKEIEEKQKISNQTAKYIMKINISQSHFTLNIKEHLKDAMNDIDIYVEVSKDFYDKYEVGDIIADDFRVGSMVFKGSFGNWKIKVADKEIV